MNSATVLVYQYYVQVRGGLVDPNIVQHAHHAIARVVSDGMIPPACVLRVSVELIEPTADQDASAALGEVGK